MADTLDSGQFVRQLRSALASLYDPVSLRSHPFARTLLAADKAPSRAEAGEALRQDLLRAMESLKPSGQAVPSAKPWRVYNLLQLRYVEARDPVDVQHQLAMSKSQYYREHEAAVDALAALVRERYAESGRAAEERVAPISPAIAVRAELPYETTSFVGRANDVIAVRSLLEEARLVTLTGAGGAGKSRLAVRIARELHDQSATEIGLVELAPLAEPGLLGQTVAAALGIAEIPGQSMVETLIAAIGSRDVILLLDNCEHLIQACAQLAHQLLQACPALHILATSREPLRIPGETLWPVPPLDTPDLAVLPATAELAGLESVRLFADRASAVRPGFEIIDANARAVAEICTRLDGIPLAIELAAARISTLSPDQIASHLDERFRLLTTGSRVALPRQKTLESLVDWSYELLNKEEKTLFQRQAVFAGGWTLEASEAICPGDDLSLAEILDLTSSLAAKSLIVAEGAAGGGLRYRMLETIREYGLQKLTSSPEVMSVRDRHSQYFGDFVRVIEARLYTARQMEALAEFEAEHDNIRALLSRSHGGDSIGLVAEVASRLCIFWFLGNHFSEARYWLDLLLSTDLLATTPWRVGCLSTNAFFAASMGDPVVAARMNDEALRQARELGSALFMAWALVPACSTSFIQGDAESTVRIANEAVPVAVEAGWEWAAAMCEGWWGRALLLQGQLDAGRAKLTAALERSHRVGDPFSRALITSFLAATEAVADYDLASEHFEAAMQVFRRLGSLAQQSRCLVDWAVAALREHDLQRAAAALDEGLDLAQQLGRLSYRYAQLYSQIAQLAFASRLYEGSVRLLAVVTVLRQRSGVHVPHEVGKTEEDVVRSLHRELSDAAFAAAWSTGTELDSDQALVLARQLLASCTS